MKPFIYALCEYLAAGTSLTFGSGETSLKIGDLSRESTGVMAVDEPTVEADRYTPIKYATIGFWAKYKSTNECYEKLQEIYALMDRAFGLTVGTTSRFEVYYSCALGGIVVDNDRDAQGDKLMKLTIHCIYRPLDIVS